MLISCPKCHSIYEIPDELVGKTGQNFRCHACANVWHVMRTDALGYEDESNSEEPYVEAIPVSEPPHRHYPANKKDYKIPADGKSGAHTRSSKELLAEEADPEFVPPKVKEKKELTLTSDYGTSFTINATPIEEPEEKNTPHLTTAEDELRISKEDSLLPEKPFKGYKKTYGLLFIIILCLLATFLRRDIVALYPAAEPWYNKISLSGLKNPEYLRFDNVRINEENIENKKMLKITAEINNPSRYGTFVPPITLSGQKETFTAKKIFIAAHDKSNVEINIPAPDNNAEIHLTLGFVRP